MLLTSLFIIESAHVTQKFVVLFCNLSSNMIKCIYKSDKKEKSKNTKQFGKKY